MWMYSCVIHKASGPNSRIFVSVAVLLSGMLLSLASGMAQGNPTGVTDDEIVTRNIPILEYLTAGKDDSEIVAVDDMLMTVQQAWDMFCLGARTKEEVSDAVKAAQKGEKAGIGATATPWTGAVVQYAFGAGFNGATEADRRNTFIQSTQMWAAAGITFVDVSASPSGDYMSVTAVSPPAPSQSTVGMGGGAQTFNINTGQMTIDTMAHELGHALGLSHPHQRWDRDTYVTFSQPPNPNDVTSLALVTPEAAWHACSGAYNVCEIMHYPCCAMAWDADAPPPPGSSDPGDWVAFTMSAVDGTPSELIGVGELVGTVDGARGRPTISEINAVRCFYGLRAAPTITVDSPDEFVVCSAAADVELSGFAGVTGEGGIISVEYTNDGLNWFTVGVTLATPGLALTHFVINLGTPGNTALPNTSGANIIGVRAVDGAGNTSSPVFITINVFLEAPSVTIEDEEPITLYDDDVAIALEIHGNAGSCPDDLITLVEYQINAFGFTSTNVEAAPLPSDDVTYVVKIPERIWSPGDFITVRATTRDGVTAEQIRSIVIIDIDPTVTIELPQPIEFCDEDSPIALEVHGNAGSPFTDMIAIIEYQINSSPYTTVNVETAPLPAEDVNYVVSIPERLWTSGEVVRVRATTLKGEMAVQARSIFITDIDPTVTIESPSPMEVSATESDVELQGFSSSCESDPIFMVEWQVAGAAGWNNATMLATSNDEFVNWVVRLGQPTLTNGVSNPNLPTNPTTINLRAQTDYGIISEVVTTELRWPDLVIQPDPQMTLVGPVGSGLGVVRELRGVFTVQNVGTAPSGQINTNLAADLIAAYLSPSGVQSVFVDQENLDITPQEFHLDPLQSQLVSVEVVIPVNTSIGSDGVVVNAAPGPGLDYSGVVSVQGDSVNSLGQALNVTVTPYRDKDLIRRGFTGFCEDCADAWQAFSFPLVGVDNPIQPTLLGSTLRNQLEDDFGLVNEGPAPFQAVRWDPARETNLSFERYTPPRELLEPNPLVNGFSPNILPGEAFSMVRRTRGDITMDGYFVDHAPDLPESSYPLARFPNWNRMDEYRGSWDPTFPPPATPLPAPPAPFDSATHLLVGNPYAFPVDIYTQGVYDGSTVMAQMNGLGAGDVVRDVRHYNRWVGQLFLEIQNDLSLPVSFSPWNGTLQPTQGCWVTFGTEASLAYGIRFNDPPLVSDNTPWPQMIDFTFSKKKGNNGPGLPADLRDLDDKAVVSGWGYRITAINGEGLSRTLVVGVYPGASEGYDSADVESMFSNGTRPDDMGFDLVISHPGWGSKGLFLREMTAPESVVSGAKIPLQILSSLDDDITLVCEAIGTPPRRVAASISKEGGAPLVNLTASTGSLSVLSGSSDYVLTLKTWESADVNQDDSVNNLDLFGFSREYEKSESSNPADLNNNNEVEALDLIELLKGMK